jgi:hypothetical protein
MLQIEREQVDHAHRTEAQQQHCQIGASPIPIIEQMQWKKWIVVARLQR